MRGSINSMRKERNRCLMWSPPSWQKKLAVARATAYPCIIRFNILLQEFAASRSLRVGDGHSLVASLGTRYDACPAKSIHESPQLHANGKAYSNKCGEDGRQSGAH